MDSINLSDVSTPDTGKGSKLKTGGRRNNNMPSKDRCKDFAKLGYKTKSDCMNYGKKKKPSVKFKGTPKEKAKAELDRMQGRWRSDGGFEITSHHNYEDTSTDSIPKSKKKKKKY